MQRCHILIVFHFSLLADFRVHHTGIQERNVSKGTVVCFRRVCVHRVEQLQLLSVEHLALAGKNDVIRRKKRKIDNRLWLPGGHSPVVRALADQARGPAWV